MAQIKLNSVIELKGLHEIMNIGEPSLVEIVIDTGAFAAIYPDNGGYSIDFDTHDGSYPVVVTKRVMNELNHHKTQDPNSVSPATVRYTKNRNDWLKYVGARVIDPIVQSEHRSEIQHAWYVARHQLSARAKSDEDLDETDIHQIGYGVFRALRGQKTLIASRDRHIDKTVRCLWNSTFGERIDLRAHLGVVNFEKYANAIANGYQPQA